MRDFDELLDGVLREDATAQPRAGLEARVMARVRADERRPRWSILRHPNRWQSWILVPAAACVGILVAVWYVSAGRVSQPDRIASSMSPPAFSARSGAKPEMSSGESGRALRDAHLSDDKAVAKTGHPALERARYMDRELREIKAAPEDEPKLESFPAVSQKGNIVSWFGGSDDGKLAAIAGRASPETVAAYQQLRSAQNEPLVIAAIEIKPLQ